MKKKLRVLVLILSLLLSSTTNAWAKDKGYRSLEQSFGSDVIDLSISEKDLVVTDDDHKANFILHTKSMRDSGYEIAKLNLYKIDASGKKHFIESEHIPLKKHTKESKRLRFEMGEVDSSSPHYLIDLVADADKLAVYDFSLTGENFALKAHTKTKPNQEPIAECDNASFSDCQVDFVIDRMFGPEGKVEFVPAAMASMYSSVIFDENRNKWQIELPASGDGQEKARKKDIRDEESGQVKASDDKEARRYYGGYNRYISNARIHRSSIYTSNILSSNFQGTSVTTTRLFVGGKDIKALIKEEAGSLILSSAFNGGGATTAGVFGVKDGVVSNSGSIYASDDFVFGSPSLANDGNPQHNRRFFFDKSKSAFRAGIVAADQWDDENVGAGSVAMGAHAWAQGTSAVALGHTADAHGHFSTALGRLTKASGNYSAAIGSRVEAQGIGAIALGSGPRSDSNQNLVADQDYSLSVGFNSDRPTFFVGTSNGAGTSGKVGIGTTDPQAKLDVAGDINATDLKIDGESIKDLISGNTGELGDYVLAGEEAGSDSLAVGESSSALYPYSTVVGSESYAGNEYATALGYNSRAEAAGSVALGNRSKATGGGSISIRGNAQGNYSIALGVDATANGSDTLAIGPDSRAKGYGSVALGGSSAQYDDTGYTIGDVAPPVAIGRSARASGPDTIAVGYSTAAAPNAIALGESRATGRASVAIGQATASESRAIALGGALAEEVGSIAIGDYAIAREKNSMALGIEVESTAEGAVVIGNTRGFYKLKNDIKESLAVGFNSDKPTFFVGSSAGVGTTGDVGIGTTNPQAKLDVAGDINAQDIKINGQSIQSLIANGSGGSSNYAVNAENATVANHADFASFATNLSGGVVEVDSNDLIVDGENIVSFIQANTAGSGSNSGSEFLDVDEITLAYGSGAEAAGIDRTNVSGVRLNTGIAMGRKAKAIVAEPQPGLVNVPDVDLGITNIALGASASANGRSSIAIGRGVLSLGDDSLATGFKTRAIGDVSFAAGRSTEAEGYGSVAMGYYSRSGRQRFEGSFFKFPVLDTSLAVGTEATALRSSVALGNKVYANGEFLSQHDGSVFGDGEGRSAVAIGNSLRAEGEGAVAIGTNLQASARYAMIIGNGGLEFNNNIPNSLMVGFNSEVPTFFVGPAPYGADSTGDVGIGTTNPQAKLDVAGDINAEDIKINGQSIQNLIAANSANGDPDARYILAGQQGADSSLAVGPSSRATKLLATALGHNAAATEVHATALGHNTRASGERSIAMGDFANATGVHSISVHAKADGREAIALGVFSEAASDYDLAIGSGTKTVGKSSIAIGYQANAKHTANSPSVSPIALGAYASVNGDHALAFGPRAEAAKYSIAVGSSAEALGISGVAMGVNAKAETSATALGANTEANAMQSTALGAGAKAEGINSVALGYRVKAKADGSVAIGSTGHSNNLENNIPNSIMLGTNSDLATVFISPALGVGNTGSVGIGTTNPQAKLDVAGDINAEDIKINGQSIQTLIAASGGTDGSDDDQYVLRGNVSDENSVAVGARSTVEGTDSIAIGSVSQSRKQYSTAVGYYSQAFGQGSSAIGYQATAVGVNSAALRPSSYAGGDYAVSLGGNARGNHSLTAGFGAKAESAETIAIGFASKAEGRYSTAIGHLAQAQSDRPFPLSGMSGGSIAIGAGAKAAKAGLALGADAKAKGKDAIALGSAEANGDYTIAIGSASAERRNAIAIGRFTKATHFGSIAIGNSYDEDRAINNNIANSLMVGFNSNQATLFVGPSLGANSSGYVGIGTTRPRAKLDVAGGIKASTANFENLGIGTSRPQAKLHVVGDIKADDIETNYLEATGPSTLKEVYATKIELTGDLQANAVRAYAVVTDGYSSIKNLDTHNGHISHLTGVQSLRALSDDVIDVQASLDINGNVELDGLEAEKLNVSEIKITEGQPSEGKVLTAVDSKGKAEWRDPPASPLNLLPRTSAPSDPKPGDVYIRKRGRDTFMCVYEGRSWTMVNFVYSRYGVYNSYCN